MKDRIFLRDYRKTIEIGAFQEERQILQDIVISIEVELASPASGDDEAVDDILSYDVLVDAVENCLAARRYNLLEALAEDIAARILTQSAAASAEVEIQKLGRVDGILGAKIFRQGQVETRADELLNADLVLVSGELESAPPPYPDPPSVYMILPKVGEHAEHVIDQHILALRLDERAWELSRILGLPVVESQTEMEALLARGESLIRAYGRAIFAARPALSRIDAQSLSMWAEAQIHPKSVREVI